MQVVAFLTAPGGSGKAGLLVLFQTSLCSSIFSPNASSCSGGEAGGVREALAVI